MMGHREKTISGDEVDAFGARSRHRRSLRYLQKPTVAHSIKARFNRRAQKKVKLALKADE